MPTYRSKVGVIHLVEPETMATYCGAPGPDALSADYREGTMEQALEHYHGLNMKARKCQDCARITIIPAAELEARKVVERRRRGTTGKRERVANHAAQGPKTAGIRVMPPHYNP